MPKQETYFDQQRGHGRVEVVKTYDRMLAREAFEDMDPSALSTLAERLQIHENFDEELPSVDSRDFGDLVWEELLDAAREDGNLLSFFLVTESDGNNCENLYVSPDWPSAEAFAKERLKSLD